VIGLLGTRRWVGGLLFTIAFAVVCCFLGRWQWNASQAPHGDLQNFAYAFNWWFFAAVGIGIYGKALRDEARRAADPAARPVGRAGLPVSARTPVATAHDGEVDEWNAWLAELNAKQPR
jgi:DNA-binding transcriptional regulator of glucitol operon